MDERHAIRAERIVVDITALSLEAAPQADPGNSNEPLSFKMLLRYASSRSSSILVHA